MKGFNQGRILLAITVVIVVVCVWIMIVNLYKAAGGIELPSSLRELKSVPQYISHEKYEDLVRSGGGLKGLYTPPSVHKKNIFSQPREKPVEWPQVEPGIPEEGIDYTKPDIRFMVTKIYKKPVKLLFKGYIQLGDGTYVATINWAGKTDFKKVGDEIRGYKVVDFKKDVSERKTLWGGTEKIDKSIVTLERDTGERFNLEIGKITLEKEIYAEILDRKDSKDYEVYVGGEILGNKVLDISSTQVIINTQNGEKVILAKE